LKESSAFRFRAKRSASVLTDSEDECTAVLQNVVKYLPRCSLAEEVNVWRHYCEDLMYSLDTRFRRILIPAKAPTICSLVMSVSMCHRASHWTDLLQKFDLGDY
jgi:hypothetical protein